MIYNTSFILHVNFGHNLIQLHIEDENLPTTNSRDACG